MRCTHLRLHPAPIALAVALVFAAPGLVHAQAAAGAPAASISIAAQPLGAALNELAATTGTPIAFAPALVAGKTAPALKGIYTVRQAFEHLLAGSGLMAVSEGGVLVIKSVPAAGSAEPVTLGAVTVTAEADHDASSEGTGSYVARVVTIGKTAQTLREIPQSVSVMTRQQIDDQQLTTLGAALAYMPGVNVSKVDEDSAYTRGYKAQLQVGGVPRASGSADDFGVNDLETFDRVEVLRGPAGLLTGRGEPGGAVNYERKRPKHEFAVAASLGAGSWRTYRSTVDVTGALNAAGTLRGRAVSALQDGDSYRASVTDKRRVLYGILEYDLTPRTTLGVSALSERRDYVETRMGVTAYTDGSLPGRSTFIGTDQPSSSGQKEYKFDLAHRFDNDWSAKVTAYRIEQDYESHFGMAGSLIDRATGLADMTIRHNRIGQTYEAVDANVSGPFELFGRKHSAMLGYQALHHTYNIQNFDGSGLYRNVDVLNRHDFPATPLAKEISYGRASEPSLYGVLRFKLRDDLTAILGGSLTSYDYQSLTADGWISDDAKINRHFTPYGGLVWELNKSTSLYASYAEIFQSQYGRDWNNNVLPPRTGEQYEVGIKQGWLNDRLNLAVAVFRLQDTNRSLPDPEHVGCGSAGGTCNIAAGLVESKGIDAELSGSPLPGWNVSAGYTYNDLKYKNGAQAGQRVDPSSTPRQMLKLWSHYDLGQGVGGVTLPGWTVGMGVLAQSDIYETGHLRQGSYAIYSANVSYRLNKHLRANLSVDNLFDKTYLSNIGAPRFQNYYGDPRKATLTLRAEF